MSNLNPLHIAGARAGAAPHFKRRARVGAELYPCPDGSYAKTRGSCPKPGGFVPPSSLLGGGGIPDNLTGGYGPPPGSGGGGSPFQCWDGSYSDGPDFCPDIPSGSGSGSGSGGSGGPTPGGGGSGGGGGGYTPPGNIGTPIPSPTPNGCAPLCNVCPENQKRYYMPFVPDAGFTASVTAGSLVRFVGKPQKLFAPDRLIIASSIAPYFDIVQLIIGNTPQSLSQGNVSAEMFSEVATYVMMTFDQAYPGIDVIIVAQNKSSVTQTFQAQLVGEAVQG